MVKYSALDVVSVFGLEKIKEAFDRTADMAGYLEEEGYERLLIAEHHNLGGTASSSTSNVIQYVLSRTNTIKVGAGGVMLSNHSPLQVAETYGTLDALYPGRVDLGIGRAPGTDQRTASLITRKHYFDINEFAQDIQQIEYFFSPLENQSVVGAYPGAGADVPIIILGSSLSSAHVAAALGLPYAFAGHFSPDAMEEAIKIYRQTFKPSYALEKPYVMIAMWTFGADTEQKAQSLFNTTSKRFVDMIQGDNRSTYSEGEVELTSAEKILASKAMGLKVIGDPSQIQQQIQEINEKYHPDEMIGVTTMKNLEDLKTNYRIFKQAVSSL